MSTLNQIPFNTILVPDVLIALNNTNANNAVTPQVVLLVGQMLNSSTATPNVPVISSGAAADGALFGEGSMIHIMSNRFQINNQVTQYWILPLNDNPNATVGTSTVTITGSATAAGTISLYVAGNLVQATVNLNDTPTIIGGSLVSAINNIPLLPVTASANAGVVTLTNKNAGATASDVDLRLNYLGAAGGEFTPAGISITFASSPGVTDPDLMVALSNLGTRTFDFIVVPYTGQVQVNEVETLLSDTGGRWDGVSGKLYGHAWATSKGTFSQGVTLGQQNNNQHLSIFEIDDEPRAVYDMAAAVVAAAAPSLIANPATPIQRLAVDVLAPPLASQYSFEENNTLLGFGLSTFAFDSFGDATIQRVVTTFQEQNGVPNNSFQNVETMYSLMFVLRTFTNAFLTNFPNFILVADGSQIPAGQNVTTAALVLTFAISVYRGLALQNIVQNPTLFAQQATAINAGNGVVQLQLPIMLANQLRTIAFQANFSTP
jgi:phage tail sheath gpL-like